MLDANGDIEVLRRFPPGNQTMIVGNLIFVDQNGDGIIDWKDQVVIGQSVECQTWNFSTFTNFKWGNWKVLMRMHFKEQQDIQPTFDPGPAGYGGISGHQSIA